MTQPVKRMMNSDDTGPLRDWLLNQTNAQLKSIAVKLDLEQNAVDWSSAFTAAADIWQLVQQTGPAMTRLRDLAPAIETSPRPVRFWAPRPHSLAKNFTGRYEQRRMLTEWLLGGPHPLLFLTGPHNGGKTELAWAWMKRDVLGRQISDAPSYRKEKTDGIAAGDAGLDLAGWWRFTADAGSSFGDFLKQFCAALRRENLISETEESGRERADVALEALRNRRILLILDEFEWETLYRPRPALDVQLDRVAFDGPRWRCYDPDTASFLASVSSTVESSRVLVTCPFVPNDFERFSGCREELLGPFNKQDALDLFRAQGVLSGHEKQIYAICDRYRYHPGDLRAVSNYIARNGDRLEAAQEFIPNEAAEGRTFEVLTAPAQQFLKLVSIHQSPFDYALLKTLHSIGSSEAGLAQILDELDKWNILWLEDGSYRLNRRFASYARRRLAGPPAETANVESAPPPTEETLLAVLRDPEAEPEFRNEDEIEPIVNVYLALVRAGAYQQAWDLWKTRLNAYLYYRFGAYHRCIYYLEMLTPAHTRGSPDLRDVDLAWLYNSLTNSSSLSGQIAKAVSYFNDAIALHEKAGSELGLATALGNVADDLMKLGRFSEAHVMLERMIQICAAHKEEHLAAYGLQVRGALYSIEGNYDAAAADFEAALRTFSKIQQLRYVGATKALLSRIAQFRGDSAAALEYAQAALEGARWKENRRDLVRAYWLCGLARLAEFEKSKDSSLLAGADRDLNIALSIMDEISLVEFEPDVFMALSLHAILVGAVRKAVEWMGRASDSIQQSGYVLKECELTLLKARIAQAEGDNARALDLAKQALEQSRFDDDQRYVYRYVAGAAEALLRRG
jgi:tetratricopeptide (TPR) repeat protein